MSKNWRLTLRIARYSKWYWANYSRCRGSTWRTSWTRRRPPRRCLNRSIKCHHRQTWCFLKHVNSHLRHNRCLLRCHYVNKSAKWAPLNTHLKTTIWREGSVKTVTIINKVVSIHKLVSLNLPFSGSSHWTSSLRDPLVMLRQFPLKTKQPWP